MVYIDTNIINFGKRLPKFLYICTPKGEKTLKLLII